MYGETTGETDEFGLPVRHDWSAEYRGSAMVVYVTATIYHRPETHGRRTGFLFAKDSEDTDFYVSRRATGLNELQFEGLEVGDRLSVRPGEQPEENKAWPVQDAISLDRLAAG